MPPAAGGMIPPGPLQREKGDGGDWLGGLETGGRVRRGHPALVAFPASAPTNEDV